MLTVRQLGVRFGDRRPVDGLNLDVASGEAVGLIGASGSGKSLTASVICGLPPIGATVTGAIRLGDGQGGTVDISAAPERQLGRLRGRCVALVGQDALTALNPLSSIGSQLAVPLRRHHPARGTRRRHTLRAAGIELLATVGLSDPERVWRAYPTQLSGGQRQRVAVALAVACRPGLLVADEPTSALDPTAQAGVLALLSQLPAGGAQPPSLLLISHDLATVAQVCRRVYVLRGGRAVETGPTRQVLGAPRHPYTRQLVAAAHTLSLAPTPGQAS